MRLYLDTNIYSFICERKEAQEIRDFFDRGEHTILASNLNLFEIFAIPDSEKRKAELATLVAVASEYLEKPGSWKHAEEVFYEIQRCRPNWLKKTGFAKANFSADSKQVKHFLAAHLRHWSGAKKLIMPPSMSYKVYRRTYEGGVAESREAQKIERTQLIKGNKTFHLAHGSNDASNIVGSFDLEDPETRWRIESLEAWHNALVCKVPASQDYADWLSPHIKENAFEDSTYIKFWLEDVEAKRVPRNRIYGLVHHYQLKYKIGHGNAADQSHATFLPDCDFFLTADRAFFKVLKDVCSNDFSNLAQPILVNRSETSVLKEIETLIQLASSEGKIST